MEIIVRKNDLVKELHLVQGIVERKNSIPILSNVLAEAQGGELRISATDLDVSLRCGCAAQVVAEGADHPRGQEALRDRALPARRATCSIKVLPDSWATIDCETRATSRWPACPGRTSRRCPEAKPGKGIEIPGDVLRDLISRTAFAITAEDARYYLAGALLVLDKEGAGMVATDGHRLVLRPARRSPLKVAEPQRVLVPAQGDPRAGAAAGRRRTARPSSRWRTTWSSRWAGASLASKTIEGQFPAFEKVIAVTGDKSVSALAARAWPRAIRRVSLLSSERSRAVKLAWRRASWSSRPPRPTSERRRSRWPRTTRARVSRSASTPSTCSTSWAWRARTSVALELKDAGEPGDLPARRGIGDGLPLRRHADAALASWVWVRGLLESATCRNIREAAVELEPGLNVFVGAQRPGEDQPPGGGGAARPRPLVPHGRAPTLHPPRRSRAPRPRPRSTGVRGRRRSRSRWRSGRRRRFRVDGREVRARELPGPAGGRGLLHRPPARRPGTHAGAAGSSWTAAPRPSGRPTARPCGTTSGCGSSATPP